MLRQYLPGVVASVDSPDDCVIVADNASTDCSLELLQSEFPTVRVIRLDSNYGFAEGYNKALEQVEAEYFVLLNSDVEVDPQWLYPLEEWMDIHPLCAACGPKLLSLRDRDSFEYAGAAGGFMDSLGYPYCRGRVMNRIEKDRGQYDLPENVMWMSGACLMVRSSMWRDLSGFEGLFFAHHEEIDFCWRAQLAGWTVSYVPRSVVWHLGGGTLAMDSPDKLYLNYRNNLLTLCRELPFTYALEELYAAVAAMLPDAIYPDDFRNIQEFFRDNVPDDEKEKLLGAVARDSLRRARWLIVRRMLWDGASAFVYLLKGRFSYVKAVFDAHTDFRKMRCDCDMKMLVNYIGNDILNLDSAAGRVILNVDLNRKMLHRVSVKGMPVGSIVLLNLAYRDNVFEHL